MINNFTSYNIAPFEILTGKYLPDFKGTITVKTDDAFLNKFGGEIRILALLDRNINSSFYTLVLRSDLNYDLDDILCHEFCHLMQMEQGRLKLDIKAKVFTWEGKRYSGACPYFSRPWEQEALKKQIELLKLYKKEIHINRRKYEKH